MKLVWPWNQMEPNDDAEKLPCYYNIIISWHKMGTGKFEWMNPKFSIFLDFLFLALTLTSRAPEIEAGVRGVQVEGKTVRLCDCRYLYLEVIGYWLLVIGIGYWLLQVLVSIWRLSMTLTGTNQNQTKTNLSCLMEGNTVRLCSCRYLYKCHLKWMSS